MTDNTDITRRLAEEIATRLMGYTKGDENDIDSVKDALTDSLKACGLRLDEQPAKASVYVTPDPGKFSDLLEKAFKDALPLGYTADDDDKEEDDGPDDDGELAELEHMRDVADMAYAALSDLALHCHNRREDVAWGIASSAAKDAHTLATFVGDWIEDMEDED